MMGLSHVPFGMYHPTSVPTNFEPEMVEHELTFSVDRADLITATALATARVVSLLGDKGKVIDASGYQGDGYSVVNLYVELPKGVDPSSEEVIPADPRISLIETEAFDDG